MDRDALALMEAAQDLARRVVFPALLPDENGFRDAVGRVVTLPGLEILVADDGGRLVGAIGVLFAPYVWNPKLMVGEHIFLWTQRKAPYKTAWLLVDAALRRIEEKRAFPIFHILTNNHGLEKVYRRHGLERSDSAFMRSSR